jgi:hypothetical protein
MGKYPEAISLVSGAASNRTSHDRMTLVAGIACLYMGDYAKAGTLLAGQTSGEGLELAKLLKEASTRDIRSPELAGILSTVIPGAGKLYAGRTADGIFSLITVGSFAGLAAWYFNEEGLPSVRGWIYASIGLIFHAGNIWGSATAARQWNERRSQIVRDRATLAVKILAGRK